MLVPRISPSSDCGSAAASAAPRRRSARSTTRSALSTGCASGHDGCAGRRHGIAEQRARGACDGADRVVRGELAQHRRQAVERHERVREERQREDDDEDDALRRVGRADEQAEQRADQSIANANSSRSAKPASACGRSVWMRQPTIRPLRQSTTMPSVIDGHLGQQVPEQVGRARHRQRAEAVDDALGRGRSRSMSPAP